MPADLPIATTPTAPAVLRVSQLLPMLGIGRMTLHRWVASGSFPKPIRLGPNAIGWKAGDVSAWIETRPTA